MDGKWFQEAAARFQPRLYAELWNHSHYYTRPEKVPEPLNPVYIAAWFSFNLLRTVTILSPRKIVMQFDAKSNTLQEADELRHSIPSWDSPVIDDGFRIRGVLHRAHNFTAYLMMCRESSPWPIFSLLPIPKCYRCESAAGTFGTLLNVTEDKKFVCDNCFGKYHKGDIKQHFHCACGWISSQEYAMLHSCRFVVAECRTCHRTDLSSRMRLSYHLVPELHISLLLHRLPNELLDIISLYAFGSFFVCCHL